MKNVKVETIEMMENFPNQDEAYAIMTDGERYAFTWGYKYPYADEVPANEILDGENGLEWYDTEEAARKAMKEAVDSGN